MTAEDLQQLDSVILAVMCHRVANSNATDPAAAEQARALKHEWASVVIRETPSPLSPAGYDDIKRQFEQLRQRMARFLIPYAQDEPKVP